MGPSPPRIHQTNTILYCDKWQETVTFYRDTLRLPVAMANDWFVEFQLTNDSFVSVVRAERATIDSAQGDGITLAWRVDNIVQSAAWLQARDVATTPIKQRWGANVLYLHDPEGNRIELWEATT